jgi:hypothetical protein
MLNTQKSAILALIAAAAFVSPLEAQELVRARDNSPVIQMTPAQQTFAQEYVAAVTGPDIERYKRLLHPRTRACMNADNADYFNNIFARRTGRSAKNPRSTLEKVKDYGMFSPARNNGVSYPARPSHLLHINLVSTASKQYALSVYLVRENGLWYEVLPCPSAKSLVMLREANRKDAEENMKARAMADSLQDPLRTQLVNLLQSEGPVVATQHYAEIAQVDPTLARRVVKALEKDLTLVH